MRAKKKYDEANRITLADLVRARKFISPYIERTELIRDRILSDSLGCNIYLKLEMFQRTGSFKVRGAFNKMLNLTESEKHNGVVAVSGGNHAQGVACAAKILGLHALILMPESTPYNYIKATKSYGAEVKLTSSMTEAFTIARHYEKEGRTYIHPFDDSLVIAGQGTIGLEILEDLPDVTDVVASIGGGGLISGTAIAMKSFNPNIRIWGVETEGADSMSQALKASSVIELPAITSVAYTLGAPAVAAKTLAITQRYVENVTVVSDEAAMNSLRVLLEYSKVLTEPAASCTLAAAERLQEKFTRDSNVVLILCGGNMALDSLSNRETQHIKNERLNAECVAV